MQLNRNVDESEREGAFPDRACHGGSLLQIPNPNSRLPTCWNWQCVLGVASLGLGSCRRARPKVPLGFDPVVEIRTAGPLAAEIAVIGCHGDLIVGRVVTRVAVL